ncbi:CHAD domain-containing protein [Campylobacter curvus]|uniref:CYTH and CHAD domain-containing protein n=1 Tax=Campylobacter curvus TaxID=200 RepID=UPI0020160C3D|nr:CHAD domain-containing protein [Campylobacter curvus]
MAVGLEIERKFLLKNSQILEFLSTEGVSFKRLEILQFYTKITDNEEVRYRSEDAKFIKTIKIGKDLVREENECECDKKEFKNAFKSHIGAPIYKDRYLFKLNNNPCNIDVFKGAQEGLCTLEVEFKDEAEAVYFNLPKFLRNFIEADVTCDQRYKNKYIALHGNAAENFDANAAFRVIKEHDIELNFMPNIKAADALRVLFFKILKIIEDHKSGYLKGGDDEALHQLRVNLRKTRSLLKSFEGVFDERVSGFFSEKFKILANSTNKKRDLDVFLEFLKTQKNADELVYLVSKARDVEHENVKKHLNDESNTDFLREWELFLAEESDFYKAKLANAALARLAAYRIRSQLVSIERKIWVLSDESVNENFHKIRIDFKRLRYVLESFSGVFEIAGFKKYQNRLKLMQELFGELQDRDVWLEILDKIPQSEPSSKIQNKIYKQIYKLREEILKKRVKFIRQTRKISRNLKIYYI